MRGAIERCQQLKGNRGRRTWSVPMPCGDAAHFIVGVQLRCAACAPLTVRVVLLHGPGCRICDRRRAVAA